ncbi:MAG: tetratricopeptide repeat protein [Nitrospira sp.]|nr:tetratricopeptide repeat protein [Nitrospira sp.]
MAFNEKADQLVQQGNVHFEKKEWTEAQRYYDEAIIIDPDNFDAWYNKGLVFSRLENYEEALKNYGRAAEMRPAEPDVWLARGDAFIKLSKPNEALKSYEKALEIDSHAPNALHGKAIALHNLGQYDKAITFYDKLLTTEPGNKYAWRNKGLIFSNLKKYEESLEFYDKSIAIDPEYAPVWDDKAAALYALERSDDAIRCSDVAIRIDPKRSSSWIRKGDTLFQKKDYPGALECYEVVANIDQSNVWAWSSKGNELLSLDLDQALVYFNRAIAKNPAWAWAWEGKGSALRKLNRHQEAITAYDKAIELDTNYAEAWLHKGDLLFEFKKYDAAIEQYRKLTEIDANYGWIWIAKGNALFGLTQYQEAIKLYDEALKHDGKNVEAWGNRGACYENLDKVDEARNSYGKAIALKPDYSWALLSQGNLFFNKEKKYDKAIEFYDRALEASNNEEVWAASNKAVALAKLGKEKESQEQHRRTIRLAEAVIAKNSDDVEAWAVKGISLMRLRELDAAEFSFKEAVRINPEHINALTYFSEFYSDYKLDFAEGLKRLQKLNKIENSVSAKTNLVEILLKTGHFDQARTHAFQALEHAQISQPYACVLRFFVAASFLLDPSHSDNTQLDNFLNYYRDVNPKIGPEDWTFRGLIYAIQNSEVAPHAKFLLLTMIDFIQGRIDSQTLSFFREPQTTIGVTHHQSVESLDA